MRIKLINQITFYLTILVSSTFSCQKKYGKVSKEASKKFDTVPIYDLEGNYIRDTLIEHHDKNIQEAPGQKSYLFNDTMKVYDSAGNYLYDSLIHPQ